MPLNKAGLKSALESAFTATDGRTPAQAAQIIADAIDSYVKTATVSVNVSTTGTAAAQTGTGTGSLS